MGDTEAYQLATEVKDFLNSNGYTKVGAVNQGIYNKPILGQGISRDSTGVRILIGSRQ